MLRDASCSFILNRQTRVVSIFSTDAARNQIHVLLKCQSTTLKGRRYPGVQTRRFFYRFGGLVLFFISFFFRTKNTLLEKLLYYLISSAHKDKARKLLSTSLTLCRVHFSHILQAQCRMFLYNVDMMSFILLLFFELSCVDVWSINYSGCFTHTHTLTRTHTCTCTHTQYICVALVFLCLSLTATQSHWTDSEHLVSVVTWAYLHTDIHIHLCARIHTVTICCFQQALLL